MRDTDQFDEFYSEARERLLLQTFALTGDLPAARHAVRDAFVIAWHHWRKATRSGDPEAWTRPHAWAHALRRHTARPWHKEKGVDPEVRATLDALARLSTDQRKILLLSLLAQGSLADHAREVGLPREEAERELQLATSQLSMARDVPSAEVRTLLVPLAGAVRDTRFPRATILRRSGTRRRRGYTLAGVAATAAAVAISGVLVTDEDAGVRAGLDRNGLSGTTAAGATGFSETPPPLTEDLLLSAEQVAARFPDNRWSVARTDENTEDDGLVAPCQTERYADPTGPAALVRTFTAKPGRRAPAREAVQLTEVAGSERAAQRAYRTAQGWFAGCVEERAQLLSTYDVAGVGDGATVLVLRTWADPVTTVVAGVARTGAVTSTVVTSTRSGRTDGVRSAARLLADSVAALCDSPAAGTCTARPRLREAPAPPAGTVPGMLSAVDLPPVGTVARPWVGTEPRQARTNYAATRCDEATFRGRGWSNGLTRSFLIPGARLPDQFGITQTVGSTSARRARAFLGTMRDRMRSCPDRDLGTEVTAMVDRTGKRQEIAAWELTTEISDDRSVRFQVAFVRHGTSLSQITFIPEGEVTMSRAEFLAVAARAQERLRRLPAPR